MHFEVRCPLIKHNAYLNYKRFQITGQALRVRTGGAYKKTDTLSRRSFISEYLAPNT